jgi:hypothetical protein
MSNGKKSIESLRGSIEVLETLREEFSEWLEEANDEAQKEMLTNVVGHVEAMLHEYLRRAEAT